MNDIFTLDEVAERFKVSTRTIHREVKAGKIDAFKVGQALRFTGSAINKYMESQAVKPGDDLGDEAEQDAAA